MSRQAEIEEPSREARRAIVFDGQRWFVRRIRVIEHDLDLDEKVYRCDQPIGPAYATLADVPEVAAEIRRLEQCRLGPAVVADAGDR